MAITFYPYGPESALSIDVGDPGYGYLEIWVPPTGEDAPTSEGRTYTVAGDQLGAMLRGLVDAAKSTDQVTVPGLWPMRADEALMLLPALQEAVVYAAAGTKRAERALDEDDPESPRSPICVRCDINQIYSTANPQSNPWCERYGHTPYGHPPAGRNSTMTWERAEQEHAAAKLAAERTGAWELARKVHEARRLLGAGLSRAEVAARLRDGRWVINEDWVVRAERGDFDEPAGLLATTHEDLEERTER